MNSSTKPYFIRALYEWCCDQGCTPYLEAWVNAKTQVPMQYVKDGRIVLNIGANAVSRLKIDNDWISFAARFSGVSHEIWIPVGHVMSIFARESGEGMAFEVEALEDDAAQPSEKPLEKQDSRPSGNGSAGATILKFPKPNKDSAK